MTPDSPYFSISDVLAKSNLTDNPDLYSGGGSTETNGAIWLLCYGGIRGRALPFQSTEIVRVSKYTWSRKQPRPLLLLWPSKVTRYTRPTALFWRRLGECLKAWRRWCAKA
jgi:hypothetical protein